MDLASEHERYICEKVYAQPVIVFNYPKDIKAFYMKVTLLSGSYCYDCCE